MPRVLVVDQDRTVLHSVRQVLAGAGTQVSTAGSVRRAQALLREKSPDLVIADAQLADNGLWAAVFQPAGAVRPRVIATAVGGTPRLMLEAAKCGAIEVLTKPLDYPRLRELALRVLAAARFAAADTVKFGEGFAFVASSAAMHDVVRAVGRAASCDLAVLLTGEPGTGKTHLARVIQRHGTRADALFAEVELAGKPPDRLLSELFGHERDTFADAPGRRLGWLERCDGGTLLFEKVDTLPVEVQSRLISVLEGHHLRRVGSDEMLAVDLRILATSRGDFERLVSEGRFRADLYHSLHEFSIALPPLRERLDDLPQLAAWLLTRAEAPSGQPRATAITADAIAALRNHRWPGNLWELESVLHAASWRCQGGVIVPDDLPDSLRPPRPASAPGVKLPDSGMDTLEAYLREALTTDARQVYPEAVALFDRYICGRVLGHTGGNQSRAARILGMTRRSLRTKIRRFDLAHAAGPQRPPRRRRKNAE